jgi:hypothetical protein
MTGVNAALGSASDEQAILVVVRDYGAVWNRHDMVALAILFADDAHWIMHWPGKSAVMTAMSGFIAPSFRQWTSDFANAEKSGDWAGCSGCGRPVEGGSLHATRRRAPSRERRSLVTHSSQARGAVAHIGPQHSN